MAEVDGVGDILDAADALWRRNHPDCLCLGLALPEDAWYPYPRVRNVNGESTVVHHPLCPEGKQHPN